MALLSGRGLLKRWQMEPNGHQDGKTHDTLSDSLHRKAISAFQVTMLIRAYFFLI